MGRKPPTLHGFSGQRRAVNQLLSWVRGSRELGEACPDILFIAPTGWGKSALASALATEIGTTLHQLFAGADLKPADICEVFARMETGDVLFLDECHSLSTDCQQLLYLAIDQRRVPKRQKGRLDRKETESIADVTVVLATDQPGRLKPALVNRLRELQFDPYELDALKSIAQTVALDLGMSLTGQAQRRIAEASQGVPRKVYERVEELRLRWPGIKGFNQPHVDDLLEAQGIDQYGLDPHQREYLKKLAGSPKGTCTLARLQAIGDPEYLRRRIEPFLIDQGLIDVTSTRGRVITEKGRQLVAEWTKPAPVDVLGVEPEAAACLPS